jgi:hypothetical protein
MWISQKSPINHNRCSPPSDNFGRLAPHDALGSMRTRCHAGGIQLAIQARYCQSHESLSVAPPRIVIPETSSFVSGIVVPIPTLPPETVIGELPTVEVPVKTGTVFVVPLPVTVCAAALIAKAAMQIAAAAILLCIVFLILS